MPGGGGRWVLAWTGLPPTVCILPVPGLTDPVPLYCILVPPHYTTASVRTAFAQLTPAVLPPLGYPATTSRLRLVLKLLRDTGGLVGEPTPTA